MNRRSLLVALASVLTLAGDQSEVNVRMDGLSARANAMLRAVEDMKVRLRRRKLGLAPDINEARARMESAMDEAEKLLADGSFARASAAMDRAEGAIRKLEARFGR